MSEDTFPNAELSLSPREQETLDLLVEELTNKEIAARMGISEKMVEKNLAHIYRKINARGRVGAVAWALKHKNRT